MRREYINAKEINRRYLGRQQTITFTQDPIKDRMMVLHHERNAERDRQTRLDS